MANGQQILKESVGAFPTTEPEEVMEETTEYGQNENETW